MTIRLTLSLTLKSDTSTKMIDAYIAGVRNIARAMFGVDVEDSYSEMGEDGSIRKTDAGTNRVSGNYWRGIGIPDTHRHSEQAGKGGDVRGDGNPVRPGVGGRRTQVDTRLKRETGLGWAGVLHPPQSGSDRLSGLPEGTTGEVGNVKVRGSHRGRRRRLLDGLKRVGAGTRFRR